MAANPWLKLLRNALIVPSTLLSLISSAQTQKPIFPTPVVSSATAIAGATTGDFNGDGLPDTAYVSAPSITVLLNQGQNNPPVSIVTSGLTCTPQAPIFTADMNKDNKLDLVFTCKEGYVVVLVGKGDGTFATPSYFAVAGVNNIASPVDLNGDGYPDIAVSTAVPQAVPAVAILLNQGSPAAGTLLAPKSYPPFVGIPVGSSFSAIATGDFNGDGKQDIFVGSGVMEVFYGNGDGTLQTALLIGTSTGTGIFAFADLNQDGITDFAYIGSAPFATAPQTLQVLLGTSNGQFAKPQPPLPLSAPQTYHSIVPFQTTDNSKTIDVAAIGSSSTTIFLADQPGRFVPGITYAITGSALPETASDGKTNLLFLNSAGATLLPGNGDGTFQGLPNLPIGPTGFATADFSGDGLTDLVFVSIDGNLTTALGRGNATFSVADQTPALTNGNGFLVAGDFNADGHPDVVAIYPANTSVGTPQNAQLFFFMGNGDGSFQPPPSSIGIDLQATGAFHAVTGDFNGDGHLDVIISTYSTVANQGQSNQTLVFLPGNGDGTFGTAVPFSTLTSFNSPSSLLSADLNHDGKLDLVWNDRVYLGKGDGTLQQQPLSVVDTPSTLGGFNGPLAIGDVNEDGIPDIVVQPPSIAGSTPGFAVYAGIGDGTFQSTPIFAVPALPQSTQVISALIGDVNADGHADLLIEIQNPTDLTADLSVYLGDGKGNFTADPNTYAASSTIQGLPAKESPMAVFARLNNKAPSSANANTPDVLVFTSGGATSLLNQINPVPTTPSPVPSSITLGLPIGTSPPSRPIALAVVIRGVNPTGNVSFMSNGVLLGTGAVTNGAAGFSASFAASGAYSITATYSGDSNNQPSSSSTLLLKVAPVPTTTSSTVSGTDLGTNQSVSLSATVSGVAPTGTITFSIAGTTIATATVSNGGVTYPYAFAAAGTFVITTTYSGDAANLPSSTTFTVTIMDPTFTFTSDGTVATIAAGQSAGTTLYIGPRYGYHGTIKFSCTGLTAGESCIFSPATVTPQPSNGSTISITLIASTTAPTTAQLRSLKRTVQGIALASLLCLALSPRRIWQMNRRFTQMFMLVLLAVGLAQLSGCSSSPTAAQNPGTPATPKGTQTITVTAADSNGGPHHSIALQLTVQ